MAALARQTNTLGADQLAAIVSQLADARLEEARLRAQGAGELPIDVMTQWLALRPIDEEILLVAIAMEIDPLFAITISALAGEEPKSGVSPKLLAQVFGIAGDDSLALRLDARHPLVRMGLLECATEGVVDTLRAWRAGPRAASFLASADEIDPVLARVGGVIVLDDELDLRQLEEPLGLLDRVLGSGESVVVIEGPEGAGRRTLAAAAARRNGRQAVALDLAIASTDLVRFTAELRALRRECWLRGAIPVLARFDTVGNDRVAAVLEIIEQITGPVIMTTASGSVPELRRRLLRVRIELPDPETRERLWRRSLAPIPDDPGFAAALARVAHRYQMAPNLIARAAANARVIAGRRPLATGDLQAGASSVIQERFGGLATSAAVTQQWDDLVLPPDTMDDIKAFVSRAQHAAQVYEQWGFRGKLGRGLGLAALFSGPPGTGKTMVAGLIARALDLELYVVDLSQVVSKWVGETEKQIGKIFDAAGIGQALLLFDEADALFAKRTDVKSSNDRYANLEVNYLLMRLEQFAGVAILTTNLDASVDPAFKRRLAAEVRFYVPGRPERERLWQTLIPAKTPIQGRLDFGTLAEEFADMSGGQIRNSVLRAAFLAAAEGGSITQAHLVRAGRTEYRNMGKVL